MTSIEAKYKEKIKELEEYKVSIKAKQADISIIRIKREKEKDIKKI